MLNRVTRERTVMLFCPPFPPLRLETETSIFIGRHSSCALLLAEDDVSRRHAEIRFENAGHVLYDLQSTNGTFLNGERIDGSRRLSPGDRVGIGERVITFCEVEYCESDAAHDADDACTIVLDRESAPPRGLSGDLAEIPPAALLQLLEMGNHSGVLEVDSHAGLARVWFERGRPVHAMTEKLAGFDAAMSVVALDHGAFRFGPSSEPVETTIQAGVTELLLEACRQMDEAALG